MKKWMLIFCVMLSMCTGRALATTVADALTENMVRGAVKVYIENEMAKDFSILHQDSVLVLDINEGPDEETCYSAEMLIKFPSGTKRGIFFLRHPRRGESAIPVVTLVQWAAP